MKSPGQLFWPGQIPLFVAWREVLERDQGQAATGVKLPEPPGR